MGKVIELTEEDMVRNRRFDTMEEAIDFGQQNMGDRPFLYGKETATGKWKLILLPEGTKIELLPVKKDDNAE